MLKVRNVVVSYGSMAAVRDVSLDLDRAEVACIIGPNGSGKSTLVRSIMNLVQIQSGSVFLNEANLAGLSTPEIVERGITLVPEGRRVFANMSVRENLLLGAFISRAKESLQENLSLMTELFPILRARLAQKAGTLSGGEQQMLAIARGLMSDPSVILLDEPSLGVARLVVDEIFALISDIRKQGKNVLLVEQNAFQSLRISDKGYVLEKGQICLHGKSTDLIENPHIKTAYLGL